MSEETQEGKIGASTVEWCAGLPLVAQRPMEEVEQQGLRREALRLRWFGIGAIPLFAGSVVVLVLLAAVIQSAPEFLQAAYLLVSVLVLSLGLPVSILLARDCFRRSKGLSGDLKCGFIKRFEGPLPPNQFGDETLARLRRAKLAPKDGGAPYGLEILPASGRVWRVTGAATRGWIVAETIEVAQTPEFASIASQWLQPVSHTDDATLLGGQRDLSPAEQGELRRYARRLWLRLLPFAAGLTLWAALPVAAFVLGRPARGEFDAAPAFFLICSALWADYHFARALLLSRRLQQDAQAGRVMILSEQASPEKESPSGPSQNSAKKTEVLELLPVSRMIWTGNGQPAAWRVLKP